MKHLVLGLAFAGLSFTAAPTVAQATQSRPPSNTASPTAAQPTQAQPRSSTTTPTIAQAAQLRARAAAGALDPNEIICQREEQATGSRIMPHMLCGTRAEWAERLKEDRNKTEEVQRLSLERVQ